MKIRDFWNQAFLSALCRLPPTEAKADADLSTQICIEHWQANLTHHVHLKPKLWQDEEIESVSRPFLRKDGSHRDTKASPNQVLAESRSDDMTDQE
jgi:hypothetical protein